MLRCSSRISLQIGRIIDLLLESDRMGAAFASTAGFCDNQPADGLAEENVVLRRLGAGTMSSNVLGMVFGLSTASVRGLPRVVRAEAMAASKALVPAGNHDHPSLSYADGYHNIGDRFENGRFCYASTLRSRSDRGYRGCVKPGRDLSCHEMPAPSSPCASLFSPLA